MSSTLMGVCEEMTIAVVTCCLEDTTIVISVKAPPTLSVTTIVKRLKGVTAKRLLTDEGLKRHVDKSLWKRGYTVRTMGEGEINIGRR